MPYQFLEEVATADIAFEASGKDLEETFRSAAEATMNVMVEDLDTIQPREKRDIKIEHEELDMLLFDFLQELIYYKDAQRLLLRPQKIRLSRENGRHVLEAETWGEEVDPARHPMRVDVKAVTLHHYKLEQTPQGWKVSIILDI